MQLTIEQQVGTAWVYSYASIFKNNLQYRMIHGWLNPWIQNHGYG